MRSWLTALALALSLASPASAAGGSTAAGWTIAYSGDHGIWLRSPGGAPHRLRAGAGYGALAWSPDGRWLAYSHVRPDGDPDGVYVMDAAGTQWWRVSRAAGRPVWSPDGRRIAIAAYGGVDVVAWDGSSVRRVVRGSCDGVSWAGQDVVAVCGRRLLDVAPDGRVRLLDRPDVDGDLAYPSGSPDGRYVAFGRRCTTAPIGGDTYCEIVSVEPGDGARRTLVPYRYGDWVGPTWNPVWIPGSHLLLVADYPRRIARVDADTGVSTSVRRGAAEILAAGRDGSFAVRGPDAVVVFAADGRRLARVRVPYTYAGGLAALPSSS